MICYALYFNIHINKIENDNAIFSLPTHYGEATSIQVFVGKERKGKKRKEERTFGQLANQNQIEILHSSEWRLLYYYI